MHTYVIHVLALHYLFVFELIRIFRIPNRNISTICPTPIVPFLCPPNKTQLAWIIAVDRIGDVSNDELVRAHGRYRKLFGRSQVDGLDGLDVVKVVECGGVVGAVVDVYVERGVNPLVVGLARCNDADQMVRGLILTRWMKTPQSWSFDRACMELLWSVGTGFATADLKIVKVTVRGMKSMMVEFLVWSEKFLVKE